MTTKHPDTSTASPAVTLQDRSGSDAGTVDGKVGEAEQKSEDAALATEASTTGTATMSRKEKREAWTREIACHIACLLVGWADASTGPLVPFFQEHYSISYTVVSMLFVGQAAGYFAAAPIAHFLNVRYGMGKVLVIGAVCQVIAYALLIPAFPFPVFPPLFAVAGLGSAVQDAQLNTYIASLPHAERRLGFLHATYGFGAAICPLAATAFVNSGILFARFYAVSLGVGVLNVLCLLYAFKFSYVIKYSTPVAEAAQVETALEHGAVPAEMVEAKKSWRESQLWQVIGNRTMIFTLIFICLYVGSEVAEGGWLTTYLLDVRDGGDISGYIASTYWSGILIGRIIFIPVTSLLGSQNAVIIYSLIALVLHFQDSFAGNSAVFAIIGLFMGPSYPISVSVLTQLLPSHHHATAIAFLAAMGQVGAALFPFFTGLLAGRFSPHILPIVMIVLLGAQVLAWLGIPRLPSKKKQERRAEEEGNGEKV
ncbi:hypothetical protein JCM8097_006138 [Rhodosporidiobolus ruineniae]